MTAIILTHLGESVPVYIKDCVHQIRLWNISKEIRIYIILEEYHKGNEFWESLVNVYNVILVYTNSLAATTHHLFFKNHYQGDTGFRKGYWKHVKERFFYMEELILRESLEHTISMEYDILLYMNLETLVTKLKSSHQTLRITRDNDERAHPGFIYIPNVKCIEHFNIFLTSIIKNKMEDMQSLAYYADMYKDKIHYLPVITESINRKTLHRRSHQGHRSNDTYYLSEDSEHFGCLFDASVVGQYVGGIDSRNTQGHKITKYENESALYNINELELTWKKCIDNFLWQPIVNNRPLCTIHVHSKSLESLLSDRPDYPKDDYDVDKVNKTLLPN